MSRAEQTGTREHFKPHGGEPLAAPNGPEAAAARALAEAAEAGDAARVASLVASGAFADARLRGGETPLMRAASRGYADVALALLDAGADASARRADGFTPLILAAFFGHEDVVRLLLERGADASARTTLGTTAEKWAASRGFEGVGALLRGASQVRARSDAPKGKTSPDSSRVKPSGDPLADVGIFSRSSAAEESEVSRVLVASRRKADESVAVENQEDPAVEFEEGAASSALVRGGKREKVTISIREDAPVFSYPSESGFQFWRFMRSWQASIGTTLILAALGVGAYALWLRGGSRENQKPAQTQQQPVVQQPVQALPAQPQATPLAPDAQPFPTPDPNAYPMAGNASQPYYDPPVVNNVPPQSGIPGDLTVVSESGAPAAEAPAKRKPEAGNANANAQPAREADDPKSDANTRDDSDRNARQPEAEPRTAPTARPTPPTPAPSSDPNRGKVIPWPPQ